MIYAIPSNIPLKQRYKEISSHITSVISHNGILWLHFTLHPYHDSNIVTVMSCLVTVPPELMPLPIIWPFFLFYKHFGLLIIACDKKITTSFLFNDWLIPITLSALL